MMKWANLPLIVLLVASACLLAVGQGPPPDQPGDRPPPPREARDGEGPREDDKRPHGRWGHDEPMDAQQIREALEVLKKIDPDKAERLQKAINENPEQVRDVLQKNFPYLGRFMAWRRYDPEGFDLRIEDLALSRQTHECAKRLRTALDAGDDELAALEQIQLHELVTEHFDIRQQIRQHDLAKLQEKIAELLEQLEERANNRDDFIEDRVEELINGDQEDRW